MSLYDFISQPKLTIASPFMTSPEPTPIIGEFHLLQKPDNRLCRKVTSRHYFFFSSPVPTSQPIFKKGGLGKYS